MLDVGCHIGTFGSAIKTNFQAKVWGVEPNPSTCAVELKSLDRVIDNFFADDIEVPDRYFDAIIFTDVLEHMSDPWAALKLAAMKLVPDDYIIASIPNLRHIDNLLHILKGKDFNYEPTGIKDKTHLRHQ